MGSGLSAMGQLTLKDISDRLTHDVIQNAFKLRTNSEDTYKTVDIDRAAPAGSGLIGAVHRLKVTGRDHTVSFIVKTLVNDPLLRKSLRSEEYFQREITFFSKVLPALDEVQIASNANESIKNVVPICYAYFCDGISDFILMEDLAEKCYSTVSNNPSPRDRNYILKTIAHLHAVSMGLRLKNPHKFAKLQESLSEQYYTDGRREFYAKYLQSAIEIDKKALAEFENPDTSLYYKKFQELVCIDPYGQMMNLVRVRDSDHMVFNHGDAWTPNFLCSEEKAVAIDFQLLRCASPATDLAYFLILCVNCGPTIEDFIKAAKLYHEYFCYYLKDLGIDASKVFSWNDLQKELKRYGKFGLLAALTSFPLLASEKCDVLASFQNKHSTLEVIPLEELWRLTPLTTKEQKTNLVNAVRIMVDLEYI